MRTRINLADIAGETVEKFIELYELNVLLFTSGAYAAFGYDEDTRRIYDYEDLVADGGWNDIQTLHAGGFFTDEEFAAIKREREAIKRERERFAVESERAEYERLKAKYGG